MIAPRPPTLIASLIVVFILTACGGESSPNVPPTSAPSTAVGANITRTPAPPTPTRVRPTNTPFLPSQTPIPPTRTTTRATNTPFAPSLTPTAVTGSASAAAVRPIAVGQGFGAQKGFWTLFFTAPTGSRNTSTYQGGIDVQIAGFIGTARRTLDIAAYEFNLPSLTEAVLAAQRRGVVVRVVTDNEDGLEDDNTTLGQLEAAGIDIVPDTRSALMHNKFIILDGQSVMTGSWNLTMNDTYRNNNNALILRSRGAVTRYQAEFDEMFAGQFGPRSPVGDSSTFTQDGVTMGVYFAAEDPVIDVMTAVLGNAQRSIDFMAFSFTEDTLGDAVIARAAAGVVVQGIFETTGSETQYAELRRMYCGGMDVRQDGNPFILHHKVFIIDDSIVITGSFNFSANATNSNDENLIIIADADLAAQYNAEFARRWSEAGRPGVTC